MPGTARLRPDKRRTYRLRKGPALFLLPPLSDSIIVDDWIKTKWEVTRRYCRFDMLEAMEFCASDYGTEVDRILGLDGSGLRPMPLAPLGCASEEARAELKRWKARELFPGAYSAEGALAGLYLYFSCLDEAHAIAQDLNTSEGSYWHGIMHRQEPDAANAGYWFRQVGRHPVFAELRLPGDREWDPFEFIELCETARVRPGSDEEALAMRLQSVEWQRLFDYCARGKASH